MTKKKATRTPPPQQTARVLTAAEVRELLRRGQAARRDVEARIEQMRKVSPRDAAARAR